MSVLGRPQHEWDEFLEETHRPRKKWSLARILWIVVPVAVGAVALIYRFAG